MPEHKTPHSPQNDRPFPVDLHGLSVPKFPPSEGRNASLSPDDDLRRFVEANNYSVKKETLSSGADLLTIETGLPHSFVGVAFRAGSSYERQGEHGALHFFEHLPPSSYSENDELRAQLQKDLKLSRIPPRIIRFLEQRGWESKIFITRDVLMVGLTCPSFDTPHALTVLKSILNAPTQTYQQPFERERARIQREIESMGRNRTVQICEYLVRMSSNRPGDMHPVPGTTADVEKYSFKQVWNVGKRHLTQENATFFIAGSSDVIALASESFESLQLFQYPLPPGSTELSSTETHAAGLTQREPITAERDLIQSPPDSCNGATFLFAGFRSDTANGHLNGERELEPKKRIAAQLVFSHLCNAVTEEVGHSKGIFYSMSSQLLRFSADSLRCYLFFDCKTETLPEAAKLVARLGANLADSLTHDSMAEITSQARAHLLKNRISLDRIEGTIVNAVAFSELRHISLKDEWNIIQSLTLEDLKAAAETLFGTPKNPRGDFSYWVPQQQRQTVQAHEDTLKHPWEKAGGNPLNTHATPHESTQLMKQSP